MDRDTDQEGISEQDEGDVTIAADIAAHFRLVQAQVFAGLQVLFAVPTRANSLHHGRERRRQWSRDQVRSQFVRVVEAATDDQPVATVHAALLDPGPDGPIEKALPFGALALTEALPVLGAQGTVGDIGDITEQDAGFGLPSSDFGARHRQRVREAVLL